LGPVIGINIPIFNFFEAVAKFENNKGKIRMFKKIILISLFISMIV